MNSKLQVCMEQKFKVILYLGNQVQGLILTLIHELMASSGKLNQVLCCSQSSWYVDLVSYYKSWIYLFHRLSWLWKMMVKEHKS